MFPPSSPGGNNSPRRQRRQLRHRETLDEDALDSLQIGGGARLPDGNPGRRPGRRVRREPGIGEMEHQGRMADLGEPEHREIAQRPGREHQGRHVRRVELAYLREHRGRVRGRLQQHAHVRHRAHARTGTHPPSRHRGGAGGRPPAPGSRASRRARGRPGAPACPPAGRWAPTPSSDARPRRAAATPGSTQTSRAGTGSCAPRPGRCARDRASRAGLPHLRSRAPARVEVEGDVLAEPLRVASSSRTAGAGKKASSSAKCPSTDEDRPDTSGALAQRSRRRRQWQHREPLREMRKASMPPMQNPSTDGVTAHRGVGEQVVDRSGHVAGGPLRRERVHELLSLVHLRVLGDLATEQVRRQRCEPFGGEPVTHPLDLGNEPHHSWTTRTPGPGPDAGTAR